MTDNQQSFYETLLDSPASQVKRFLTHLLEVAQHSKPQKRLIEKP